MKFIGVRTAVLLASLVCVSCSVEDQDSNLNNAPASGETEFGLDSLSHTVEHGEPAACTNLKTSLANKNIFFDAKSKKELRYINKRLKVKDAIKACAASSPVAKMRLATEQELKLFAHLFTVNKTKCKTDVWGVKKIVNQTANFSYIMPDAKIYSGLDAKVICIK
jgi:hypothetical protein